MRKFWLIFIMAAGLTACGGPSDSESKPSQVTTAPETSLPKLSGEYVWTVDSPASTLQFEATEKGKTFTGTFGGFQTAIRLNPDDPGNGEIHSLITIAPIDAGDGDRNAELPTKAWFHIDQFPTAQFVTTDIERLEIGQYRAKGTLTIKGIAHPVDLVFSLAVDGKTATANGEASLNRLDFDLGNDDYWTIDEKVAVPVKVKFTIQAKR